MNRLNRLVLFSLVVVASIWTARSASAQDQSKAKSPAVSPSVSDSVTLADVQKAADQLAMAVQEAVRKATEDPAVKVAALKVAKNAVTAVQIVVTQQAETLQAMLDALARELAMATEKQQSRSKSKNP
jgi:hypothetical protein